MGFCDPAPTSLDHLFASPSSYVRRSTSRAALVASRPSCCSPFVRLFGQAPLHPSPRPFPLARFVLVFRSVDCPSCPSTREPSCTLPSCSAPSLCPPSPFPWASLCLPFPCLMLEIHRLAPSARPRSLTSQPHAGLCVCSLVPPFPPSSHAAQCPSDHAQDPYSY